MSQTVDPRTRHHVEFLWPLCLSIGKWPMNLAKLRSPIVLVPGLFGFDRLKVCGWEVASYFSGIPDLLGGAGNRVYVAQPSPTGGVAQRAAELKAFIDQQVSGEPVHIVAHSMGGLDARYMISCLDLGPRVLT